MKKLMIPVCAFAAATLSAFGESTVDLTDKILTIDVPQGEEYVMSDASQLKPATVTNVVKKGEGTLKWTVNAKNYRGEIHIEKGTLNDAALYFLGSDAALTNTTLYIASGATWSVTRPNGGVDTYSKVDVADGAILSFTKSPRFRGGVTLHGNTTFTGSCSFEEGVLDMNGYNLTGSVTALNVPDVKNPGTVTTSAACTGPGLGYAGSSAALNVVMVNKAFTFTAADDVPCYWNISFAPYAGTINLNGGTRLDGTLTVGTSKSLTVSQTAGEFHLRDKVTAATLSRSRAAATELWLHAANDIGAIIEKGGVIVATRPEAISAVSAITLDTASIDYRSGFALYPATTANPDGWTKAEIDAFLSSFSAQSSAFFGLAAEADDTATYETDLAAWANTFYFGGYGRGVTVLSSPTSAGNATALSLASGSEADFRITGQNDKDLGVVKLGMSGGHATLADAGAVSFTTDTTLGTIGGGRSVMTVGAGSSLTTTSYLRVPNKNNARAALEILDGGALTNKGSLFMCSSWANMESGFFLRGGEFASEGMFRTGWMADTLSYVEQTAGTWCARADVMIGGGSTSKEGVYESGVAGLYHLKGGDFSVLDNNRFFAGASGTGVVYQTGGRMTLSLGLFLAKLFDSSASLAGWGEATVAGGLLVSSNDVVVADTPNSTGILNLKGSGVLETTALRRQYPRSERGNKPVTNENGVVTTKSYVNFNGGTLKALKAGSLLMGGNYAPDRITVFAGGLTVDTNGKDVAFDAPLQAPMGSGVVALTLPDDGAPLAGYFIAPRVVIEGDGVGATAVAEFDSAKGEVTGVTVTSAGWGYTAANTTAKLLMGQDTSSGGWTSVDLGVTIAADAGTGGLVKKGSGTLTLNVAGNAYAGATTVEGGLLKLGVAGALPNATLVMKGGALSVADGVSYPDGLVFDVSGITLSESVRRVVLAENWTGPLPTVVGLKQGHVVKVFNGNLVLCQPRGLLLLVR